MATWWAYVQGHGRRGPQPGDQVYDAVWVTGRGAGSANGRHHSPIWTHVLAAVFFAISLIFVHRSFYSMRIGSDETSAPTHSKPEVGVGTAGDD